MATNQALPELAAVPWRQRTDAGWLRRWARIWHAWTLLYTVPFLAAGAGMLWLEPLSAPVALAAIAHAWIIPELYAFRGASVVRPKGFWNEGAERAAQGLLGDLLGHEERELQRTTGVALERGDLGVWLVGEAGALLVTPGGSRVHCFCVRTTEPELPPSDRIAHLLLALRVDEEGFATVANHAFAGAPLRTTGRPLQAGRSVALSVRQHEIGIANEKPQSADNHLPAVVTRQVFLGSVRDYTVALDDKTELRVTAPPGRSIAPGQAVWLHLPAEQCRALAEE